MTDLVNRGRSFLFEAQTVRRPLWRHLPLLRSFVP
jgi:hypothetical protein